MKLHAPCGMLPFTTGISGGNSLAKKKPVSFSKGCLKGLPAGTIGRDFEMNYARSFLLVAILYLLAGMGIGMHMGAADDFTLSPAHAHINLLGFTLMSVFALSYAVFPRLGESAVLAKGHFWLYQIGALGFAITLVLMLSKRVSEAAAAPAFVLFEIALVLSVLLFGANVWRRVH